MPTIDFDATPAQVSLAWMMSKKDNIIPIPGTTSIKNTESNFNASNLKLSHSTISQIDEQGPNVDVTYTTGGVTYNSRNYTTNKDVTVTLTSDESVKEVEGWTRSQDGKQLTKTYLVTENPSGKTEKVLIKDNFGNVTTKPVYIKIDTEKPYVTYPKEELSSHNGVLAVNITFNEICTIVSGDGWTKPASGGPNMISKTFTGATSEEGENVIVKDAAGNECEIGIRVRNDNGMLVAEIFDTTPPILEKIMYGTTSITNMNVRVTLIVNEKIQEKNDISMTISHFVKDLNIYL